MQKVILIKLHRPSPDHLHWIPRTSAEISTHRYPFILISHVGKKIDLQIAG